MDKITYTLEVTLLPYRCKQCGIFFAVDADVQEAPLFCPRGHPQADSPTPRSNGAVEKTKTPCPVCGKEFVLLNSHMRMHPDYVPAE